MPSIGLAYLATVAKSLGHDVLLLDAEFRKLPIENLAAAIVDWRPDIVGISIPSPLLAVAKRLVHRLSTLRLGATLIVGGVHPTIVREEIFSEIPAIDIAFIKEAETSFREYLQGAPLDSIAGIIFRGTDGNLVATGDPSPTDIDKLPFIDRDLVENDPWESNGKCESYVCSSRGCPFKCTFCSGGLLQGKAIRQRSIENVILEISYLAEKYGVNYIHFVDDNFIISRSRAIEFCNAIAHTGLKVGWRFLARASVLHQLHDHEFHMLRAAGCELIGIGVESGSPRICELIKKDINLEWVSDIVRKATESGIATKGFFIVGFPFEEESDLALTRKFILESGLTDINISLLRAFPGTELYDELLKTHSAPDLAEYLQHTGLFSASEYSHERIKKAELYMMSHFVNLNPFFSIEELAQIITDIYRQFYSRRGTLAQP
ncbi:MAG TPA: radical SAM protein [Anaerolineales bacterium]|nr:radical SAM protein [Anaerolineales bacterium]